MRKQSAFSLVELSIVLVILGLLVGGVLAGQSLIRAAELRAVSAEFTRYQAAANTFKDKYFALPGDMSNATAFWPSVLNGDGNGSLRPMRTAGENFQFWLHLQQAGLIEGTLSGVGTLFSDIDVNVPRSRMSNAGWDIFGLPNPSTVPSGFPGACETIWANFGNSLNFGAERPTFWLHAPSLRPEEAWNIDTKMDDGKPQYGKITASQLGATCFTGSWTPCQIRPQDVVDYALSNSRISCALSFNNVF